MNLLTLQQYDYDFSIKVHDKIKSNLKETYGLFMHCSSNKDTDAYLMSYCEFKTLRDNIDRLWLELEDLLSDIRKREDKQEFE